MQPLWLKSLDDIKRGISPEETAWHMLTSLNRGPHEELDADVELGRLVISEKSESNLETSNCPYKVDDLVCMSCWRDFCRTGTRNPPSLSEDADDTSEEQYSPFHIHS